ncbi:MAG: hypothetical protein WBN39_07600 [Flavobacteriaceae bacterium]
MAINRLQFIFRNLLLGIILSLYKATKQILIFKKQERMKKLMVVAVMSLGSLTAFAQEEQATEVMAVATEVATEAVAPEVATEAVAPQDGFAEVAIEELPAAITEALAADYPGTSIAKAFVNETSQYKLEVASEDGTSVELYADADGNWIEM